MTIIVQIKAEIERRLKILREDEIVRQNCSANFLEGKIYGYEESLSLLDDIESEKPMNQEGLDKEIDEISIHVPCSEFTHESEFTDLLGWLKEQFTYFYDLGCRRTAEKYDEIECNRQRAEEEVCKEFDEECERYFNSMTPEQFLNTPNTVIARHFAQWQRERMMKEAVEGIVTTRSMAGNIVTAHVDYRYKDGQKVRVIVLPKEETK